MSDQTRRPGGTGPAGGNRPGGEERPIEGLDRLRVPPPADLEDAVVDALSARGWIDRPRAEAAPWRPGAPDRRRRSAWMPWAMAAVAAGIFLLGIMVGGRSGGGSGGGSAEGPGAAAGPDAAEGPGPAAGPSTAAGSRFLVLLYEGPGFVQAATDAENAAVVQEYIDWSDSIRDAGYELIGEELADRGGALAAGPGGVTVEAGEFAPADTAGGATIPPGPSEGPDVLAGFHVLTALDLDAAIEVARSHPHLARGGRIVVRPIVEH